MVDWFACARTEVPAFMSMLFFVSSAVAAALSVSLTLELADDKFSTLTAMLLIVDCNRFWRAPKSALMADTEIMA